MQFEKVTALAFGPFRGEHLEFAQGMTVIHGPNESGKSSWHAALYAGLCGIRRGAGIRADDRVFRDRHRPWGSDDWEVSAVVRLADGRRVELRHDLGGKVACQARDADQGRDYSGEIMFEGTPDGSRWLGLDRKSFLTTACVRQADIQLGIDQAAALQDHLQRAAATAGTNATAAAAIATIDSFRSDSVGNNYKNSTKPLRVAAAQIERVQARVEAAKRDHREYLRLLGELEQLQGRLDDAGQDFHTAQAALARIVSQKRRHQADRARELADRNPVEPPGPAELRQQVQNVQTVLGIWDHRPDSIPVSHPTSDELLRQIQDLPSMPDGDTKPHPDIVDAEVAFRYALSDLKSHQSRLPSQSADVATGNLMPQEIRHLAAELALEEPEVDLALNERVEQLRAKLENLQQPAVKSPDSKPSSPLLSPLIILFRVLANLLRSLFRARKPGVDFAAVARTTEELRQAETAQGETRYQRDAVRKRKETAKNAVTEADLPANKEALIDLAAKATQAIEDRNEMIRWKDEDIRLRGLHNDATETLRQALGCRGVSADQDLLKVAESYIQECERRHDQAQQAARKPELERVLEDKKVQEAAAADSDWLRSEAARNVEEAARAIGVSDDAEEPLVETLRLWLGKTEHLIREQEEAKEEWRELQELLNSRSVVDLEGAAVHSAQEAEQLAVGIGEAAITGIDLSEDPESLLGQRRQAVQKTETDLAEKRGQFEQFISNIPSVAEAEEEFAKAEAELHRVQTLDQTLAKTRKLLSDAQDKVHRSLAPQIRDALKPWFNSVTHERYQDVRVNVESLAVSVSATGKNWRDAKLLSHGTAEQIYLLLRVVMSQLLTKNGETCPLVLDDVTVHCDPDRQRAILSLLHEISGEQQVILFSQEPETLEWAEECLSDNKDSLIRLDSRLVPA